MGIVGSSPTVNPPILKMNSASIKILQQRIACRVKKLLPKSDVVWQKDPESSTDWIIIVLNLQRSEFPLAKSAIREFREEAELLGIGILPMVKDVETSVKYFKKSC